MLVLAPAACIMSGIALSQAFDVFTRSIKFQLPFLSGQSDTDVSIYSLFFPRTSSTLHYSDHFMRSSGSYCVLDNQGGGFQF